VLQNLTVISITDGCSRQCAHCGMSPPRHVKSMDFELFAALSSFSLKVVPYYRSEPSDYFDALHGKDLSDIVEEGYRNHVRLHVTSAWWSRSDERACRGMAKLKLDHMDSLRMSVHLCWPSREIRSRVRDMLAGSELLLESGMSGLAMNVSYCPENRWATEKLVDLLFDRFPGLFSPDRLTYYLVFREGRSASREGADPTRRVFQNKLLVMPSGELCVGYRRGPHYRLCRTQVPVTETYDAASFARLKEDITTYLGQVPDGASTLEEYLETARETLAPHSPRLQAIFRTSRKPEDVLPAIHGEVDGTDCYFDLLYRCFGEIFAFDTPAVRDLAERVLGTKHENCEIYRRVLDFLYRTDMLAEYARLLEQVILREPVRFRALIDALGFLDGGDSFLDGLEARLSQRNMPDSDHRRDAAEIINRARARKAFLRRWE